MSWGDGVVPSTERRLSDEISFIGQLEGITLNSNILTWTSPNLEYDNFKKYLKVGFTNSSIASIGDIQYNIKEWNPPTEGGIYTSGITFYESTIPIEPIAPNDS